MGHSPGLVSPHALIHPDKVKADPGGFTSVPCGQQRSSSGSIDGEAQCRLQVTNQLLTTYLLLHGILKMWDYINLNFIV